MQTRQRPTITPQGESAHQQALLHLSKRGSRRRALRLSDGRRVAA
jgi:hypothetical protein